MNFLMLVNIELKKLRRTGILLILLTPMVILWIPSVINAKLNFNMQFAGIRPEYNFLIQGFLGMAWFIYPASMVVCTILMHQLERTGCGIVKMLSLPVSTAALVFARFAVLLILAGVQILMAAGVYYISAALASHIQGYPFVLPPLFVCREAVLMYLCSIPMLAVFQMISVCILTPVFALGTGLALVVPSILAVNTKYWFLYPMAYPFYIITNEYGKLAENLSAGEIQMLPWLSAAAAITMICLRLSCLCYRQTGERTEK